MPVIVHHLAMSQSERVVWLCEELGLEYDLRVYDRNPVVPPPSYTSLHLLSPTSVIEDGLVTVAESAACVRYIAKKHGNGRFILPPEHDDYEDYLIWFRESNQL